jgi:hypothetical protein
MDIKKVQRQLISIATIVDSLIAEVQGEHVASEHEARTICPMCNEPFEENEEPQQGVHKRCYKRASREKRIEELVNAGVLIPAPRGRKKKIDIDLVIKNVKKGAKKSNGSTKKKSS